MMTMYAAIAAVNIDQRLVTFMRKYVLLLLLLLSLCLCGAAHAASFTFDDFSAACEIDENKYTILTPTNLGSQTAWLESRGMSEAALLADWTERGVLLQAWTNAGDACLEITAVQDEFAAQYYDVNQVTEEERKAYRLGHSSDKDGYYRAQGYDYESPQWKNMKNTGRFLQLQYTRTLNGETYRGYARKTIRNGWSIQLDYQVYGRGLKNADKNALDDVMDTWEFLEIFPRPATSVSKLIFTARPPRESNTGKFTVSGTGSTGLHIIGTVMSMSSSEAELFETTIGKNGKFELDVALPKEGVWLMTYTVENGAAVVEEGVFDTITYQKDLLTVSLNSNLPTHLTGKELVISGTTMRQTMVQCIVDGRYHKSITTNNTGKFSFTIDTSAEGDYTITLVFEKKGYATRRFRSEASRVFTEEDQRQMIRDEAVKPAYKTLVGKLSGYAGKYMVYTLYVERIEQTATGYVTFASLNRTKSGVYQNPVVIRTSEEPDYAAGAEVRMYLKCIGSYEVHADSGVEEYPYFDLQWIEQ
ncbi:MAG: hypothetical protein E7327_01515 [Clostridiales bacterium]|nr:hypothetical protein [Clostridiales bacterium]